MQSLNISSLHDHDLQAIAIPQMKHLSLFSINNTLAKLCSILITHWATHIVKVIPYILTPITVVILIISIVSLYCKCWQNKYVLCTQRHWTTTSPPPSNDINLATFLTSVHRQPHQVAPQINEKFSYHMTWT